MIFKLLKRIFKEHAGAHFWVPIVVVIMLSFFFDLVVPVWRAHQLSLSLLLSGNWLRGLQFVFADHGRELVSIYLAFAWVVWRSVKKASDVRWTLIGDLSDNLEDADRYFAIGTIPLREWFEPNAALYLATIIQRQNRVPHFRHERVLLFYDESDFKALQASYLDQHYARSFSAIHDRFQIPLAYLKPKEISGVLKQLDPEDRLILAPYRWYAWKGALWDSQPLHRLAKDPSRLRPFALIQKGSKQVILSFSKDGNSLAVEQVSNKQEESACESLVRTIEGAIYKSGSTEIRDHANFGKYLCP